MFHFVGLIQQWRNRGKTTAESMWELNCPSFKRGQEDHTLADACDTTSEGMPVRRVQGDLSWNNENNTFNTFHCLFYFKLQAFDYAHVYVCLQH